MKKLACLIFLLGCVGSETPTNPYGSTSNDRVWWQTREGFEELNSSVAPIDTFLELPEYGNFEEWNSGSTRFLFSEDWKSRFPNPQTPELPAPRSLQIPELNQSNSPELDDYNRL